MDNNKKLTILGYAAMGVGMLATGLGNVIANKQQEVKINEAATKAVTKVLNNKEG